MKVQGDSIRKKKKRKNKFSAPDARARFIEPSAENLKVHTERFHSGGPPTWTFIVDGANDINPFVMCSPSPLEHCRQPDDTTWACRKLADVNVTLHDVVETSVVDSAGDLAGTTLSRNKQDTLFD